MNIKIVKLLTAICAVLTIIVGLEWVSAKYSQSQLLASIESSNPQKPQIDEVPTIDLEGKTEESYSEMVARPLFIKGRRPVDEPAPELANAQPGSDVFDWQLNGVYTTQKGLSALFSRAKTPVAKDNYRKLRENDDLDGWKLSEIHKDKVILNQGSEPKELLLRKPKPKNLPPTATDTNRVQNQGLRGGRLSHPPVPQRPINQQLNRADAPENSDNE